MANTQTTVPIFTAAQVLEAAQLNNSAATGVPVFATTVTRDAGFGGAGEKALAEGQLCYLESTNVVQYYDGAAWATVGPAPAVSSGLAFITSGSVSAQTAVTISNCFSSTYDNYKLIISEQSITAASNFFLIQYGISTADTTADYLYAQNNAYNSTRSSHIYSAGTTIASGLISGGWVEIQSPNLAAPTNAQSQNSAFQSTTNISFATAQSIKQGTTQYTSLFLSADSPQTFTFKYALYGYAKS